MIQLLFDIKTRTLGFTFCQPPKKTKISHPKRVTTKFQTPKKSSDCKFQTPKRASHIPVTYIPEYPPWDMYTISGNEYEKYSSSFIVDHVQRSSDFYFLSTVVMLLSEMFTDIVHTHRCINQLTSFISTHLLFINTTPLPLPIHSFGKFLIAPIS